MKNKEYQHLSKTEREIIELLLNADARASQISVQLHRDPRTISNEINRNRYLYVRTNAKNCCGLQDICKLTRLCNQCLSGQCKYCSFAKCSTICPSFDKLPHCKRTKKFPFVCNACHSLDKCSLPKLFYKAERAHDNYLHNISAFKRKIKLSELDLAELDKLVREGIKKNHSLAVIVDSNRLPISVSTLYRYIDSNFLTVKNIDLKRKVTYKQRYHNKPKAKPFNYNYRQGRSYQDYCLFITEYPLLNNWQMDIIEGIKGEGQSATLSLLHTKSNLQLFFKLKNQSCETVVNCFNSIRDFLGEDLFAEIFTVLLTDNDSAFRDPLTLTTSPISGEVLISLFYCDPRRSDQKAKCEKNHVHFRECFPKGISMNLLDKKALNFISNQINNYPRKSLNFNSPFSTASMMLNKKAFELNNLTYLSPKKVSLKRFK